MDTSLFCILLQILSRILQLKGFKLILLSKNIPYVPILEKCFFLVCMLFFSVVATFHLQNFKDKY